MKKTFYAIVGTDDKDTDIVMDWETEKLCIYDVRQRAVDALKQLKKHYPKWKTKIIILHLVSKSK